MKKIKLLTPILTIGAVGGMVAPILTSCSCSGFRTITADDLKIVGYTLKGLKDGVDISNCNKLEIPEGVKYIDNNAFKDVFGVSCNVQTIVFPKGIREIREGAFDGCTSIRTIDVSDWTTEELYYVTMESDISKQAFANMSNIGQVIMNDSLSVESQNKIKSLFINAGLDAAWFAEDSTGKMTADSEWKSQKVETGKEGKYLFTCDVKLADDVTIYAQVIRHNSTKGVDIVCTELTKREGTNVYELPVKMVNTANEGDFAEFSVRFVAMAQGIGYYEPVWAQTLDGFKIINIKADEPTPTSETIEVPYNTEKQNFILTDIANLKTNVNYTFVFKNTNIPDGTDPGIMSFGFAISKPSGEQSTCATIESNSVAMTFKNGDTSTPLTTDDYQIVSVNEGNYIQFTSSYSFSKATTKEMDIKVKFTNIPTLTSDSMVVMHLNFGQ